MGIFNFTRRAFRVSDNALSVFRHVLCVRANSSGSDSSQDIIKKFYHPDVQSLLSKLTNMDLDHIFRNRKVGQKLREPLLSFMTVESLEETIGSARRRANKLLQMPPVLPARKPRNKILAFDPYIQGHDNSSFVMADITMNVKDKDRIVVVRDPDGTLREASWEERTKMNNTYFPIPGRSFTTPKMFSDPSVLKDVLERVSPDDNTYEFVLDRACLQFEPDDPLYISVVETTYDSIDQKRHYDFIRATRHYGPFVFYLIRTRKMDNLLIYNLQKERVQEGSSLMIALFHLIFPECKSRVESNNLNDIDSLRKYVEFDAVKKSELELAINAYEEIVHRREEIEEGLNKAHGF